MDIATATHTFGVSNLDVTVNATGDGVEYNLNSMPVNGNTIDVKVEVTTGSNQVEVGLYDINGTPMQTPQFINGGNVAGQVLFSLPSTQSNYRLRATGNTVAGLLPQNVVTNGHLQTWNSYNSGIPFTNTTTQDITANNPAEGASYTFTTPAPGIQVSGTISVLAGNNDAVVEFFDQVGTSVYGPVTVTATTTANINFSFTSNTSLHEVRVTSDPLGSTYPDVMYVTAFDATAMVPGQVPDNFSITNVHVLESLYVAAPDKFYVKNVTANATAYPAKAYVTHLSATQQFTVSRPVCSNVEDFLLMTRGYRFGFNGKEYDTEVSGYNTVQDYGMRIYNTSIGRFLSVDPIAESFAWLSTYQFAANTPVWAIDFDGLEAVVRSAILNGITYTFTWQTNSEGKINGQNFIITCNDVNFKTNEGVIDLSGSLQLVRSDRSEEKGPDASKLENNVNGVPLNELMLAMLRQNSDNLQLLIIGNHAVPDPKVGQRKIRVNGKLSHRQQGTMYRKGMKVAYDWWERNIRRDKRWTLKRAKFVKNTYFDEDEDGIHTFSRYNYQVPHNLSLDLADFGADAMGITISFSFEAKKSSEKRESNEPIRLTPRYL